MGASGYDIIVDGMLIENIGNAYEHKGLITGTEHKYSIRAKNSSGLGRWSVELVKWTLPGIPGNLAATSDSSSITVTWDTVGGVTGYDIEVYGTAVDNGLNTTYVHTGLNPNTQRAYRVRAKNSSGAGKWSQMVARTTLPGVPANITADSTDTSIILAWDPAAGATGYDIEIDAKDIVRIIKTSYLHSGLLTNTGHSYRIRSKNADGSGEWSQTIQKTTLTATPLHISAAAASRSITVNWDSVNGATGYDIEVDGVVFDNRDGTSYLHDGLVPNSEHSYRVRARSGMTVSAWSEKIVRLTLPGKPVNLSGTPFSKKIALKWDAVDGAESYEIEADGIVVDNGISTSYENENLSPNSSHTYKVRAKNKEGNGDWSDTLNVMTLVGVPSGINTTSTSASIRISWDKTDGAEGYEISVDGEIKDIGTDTSFVHSGLTPNSQHVYRVRAKNVRGTGEWSEVITKWTLVSVPKNITTTSTSTSITVKWNSVPGASGYDIEVDGTATENIDKSIYLHDNLTPNTKHTYKVRARNNNGFSDWSEPVSKLTAPPVPKNLTAKATTSEITVSWDSVAGATGYDIEVDGEEVDNGTNTSYVHSGLAPNTFHTYRVRARNTEETGEWSPEIRKI